MANKQLSLWVWEPTKLNWWVAVLFMIGAAHFALGCVLYLFAFNNEFIMDLVFFIGSLFFTSAAYCQFHQSINDSASERQWFSWQLKRIVFWSAFSQFIGTLMFNINTFDAFFNLDWFEQELLVWTPNMLGSILFQISGCLAMFDISRRWWCWKIHSINWWITFINYIGCVAFLISAVLSFVITGVDSMMFATWATIFTLIGAICFFVGAYLMWPEMSNE